ncbi:MAG: hypothetical protein FWG68_11060 [Defluviitaleaceae bacterium]|nr:hypothetical protein [Defluviitaleaceae bacterium]
MKTANIVFIGAGSMSFGVPTFQDLFTTPELAGAELRLVDIDPENLERMYGLALKMNEVSGLNFKITKTVDRLQALPGADYVVNSLAIERCELWKHDFRVPLKHGIKHCLGENGGPGALFFSMRTIPLILEICADMEKLCPNAWFLNFSNPESRIVLAVNKYTKIKCIGLCHGIFMGQNSVADILGVDSDEIVVTAAGLNHFQWLMSIRRKADNTDLYPALAEKEKTFDPTFMPFSRKIFRTFNYWPTCSDDHMGEYLMYGYEGGMHGYDFDWDEQERINMRKNIADMVSGATDVKDWLHKSGEKAVEVLTALHTGVQANISAAIVYNGGAITNLPTDLAVEIPIVVSGSGVSKAHIGDMPKGTVSLMNLQVGAQQLAVDAAVFGDKNLARQALLCDPVINDTNAAEKILEELWEINKQYIKCVI